jgi:hypothetical protein
MSNINRHKFDFELPMYPMQTIGQDNVFPMLKMDGKELKGVTGLHVRAGNNGFTNVVMEFEANCAVEFVGHLIANVNTAMDEESAMLLSSIYQDALKQVQSDLDAEGEELEANYFAQAELVKRIIELSIENSK